VTTTADERRELARLISGKLNNAKGPTAFLLPQKGIHAWDLPGHELHDAESHKTYVDEFRRSIKPPVQLHDLDAHINDPVFVTKALEIFDSWMAQGLIPTPTRSDPGAAQ
jgi:uncharacterized protein (UPF0261 family)